MESLVFNDELEQRIEREERERAEKKDYSFSVYHIIQDTFDEKLAAKDYPGLLTLLDYFENSEAYPNLVQSSETRRVYISLLVLQLELKYNDTIFLSAVSSYQEFINHYVTTNFALRRLELNISPSMTEEASAFLNSFPISFFAVRGFFENELFERPFQTCHAVYNIKKEQWSTNSKISCLEFLNSATYSEKLLLEQATLCIENHAYVQACQTLSLIKEPTNEIRSLISTLKGLLPNE